ncbi:MAG: hypothetical protein D6755_00755 [Anaerolineae bacterium]|nr:MAG: hypothetical protein D6755_00755 [Anaerolineae bacterium]
MKLIDWYALSANALWIVSLALVLSLLGYAWWESGLQGRPWRQVLQTPASQWKLNACGVLFCLGVGLTAAHWWEQALWALLGVSFAGQGWMAWRNR